MQKSVQQDYLPGLYHLHPPFYQKCFSVKDVLLPELSVECPLFSSTFVENPEDGERIPSNSQSLLIFSTRKFSLNKFLYFPIEKIILPPSN